MVSPGFQRVLEGFSGGFGLYPLARPLCYPENTNPTPIEDYGSDDGISSQLGYDSVRGSDHLISPVFREEGRMREGPTRDLVGPLDKSYDHCVVIFSAMYHLVSALQML